MSTANAARGIAVHPTAAATRWGGERIDYDHTIWILCARARVGLPDYRRHDTRHVSAETSAGADRTRAPDFGDDALRYWDGTAWQVIKE